MKNGLTGMAAALALVPAAATAQRDEARVDTLCIDLRRLVEAAEYDHGFAALERARGTPPRLGFPGGCRATGDERGRYWLCSQQLAPEERSAEALAARVAACLPEAVREEETMRREARFTLPYAEIRISEHGGPRAHVGRVVELLVEATE